MSGFIVIAIVAVAQGNRTVTTVHSVNSPARNVHYIHYNLTIPTGADTVPVAANLRVYALASTALLADNTVLYGVFNASHQPSQPVLLESCEMSAVRGMFLRS